MYKIGIAGVHSAGKTSLAYLLSAHFKMLGINVKLIHESVRENCPFPINAEANQGTCLWNFHKQFLNELESEAQGYELAVCDRSVMDTFVYFHAVNPENNITLAAINQAAQWLPTYDALIIMEPNEDIELYDDGIRAIGRDYQRLIKQKFDEIFNEYGQNIKDRIIKVSSQDVFDEERREKLFGLIEAKVNISVIN